MVDWEQKRFWTEARPVPDNNGFTVELDGRRVKTPGRLALHVPTLALAEMVAAEWNAQIDRVDPVTMPATRMVNAAIDKVRSQHSDVANLIAEYGGTDLLCYRANSPQALAERQANQWDPALKWACDTLGVRLVVGKGVMYIPQDPADLARLSDRVHLMSEFKLSAFHDLVSMSGSLILGFAVVLQWKSADQIWSMSRLDDIWQEEIWGPDQEANEVAAIKRQAFLHAARFFHIC